MTRTAGANFINAKDGAGVYIVGANPQVDYEVVEAPLVASPKRCAVIYRELIERCALSDEHRRALLERGLSDEEIEAIGYRSAPDNPDQLARLLDKLGHALNNVPGFYLADDGWRLNTVRGFMIPALTEDGAIQRIQIRTHWKEPKYLWLSSSKAGDDSETVVTGASSGTVVHFRPGETAELYLNEALLKADYMWVKSGGARNCAGVGGVNTNHQELAELTLNPHYTRAVICFDGNWRSNSRVAVALARLYRTIQQTSGLDTTIAVWASECGVDDAIKAGLKLYEASYGRWYSELNPAFRREIDRDAESSDKMLDYK